MIIREFRFTSQDTMAKVDRRWACSLYKILREVSEFMTLVRDGVWSSGGAS